MICPNCGKQIEDNYQYCPCCRYKIERATSRLEEGERKNGALNMIMFILSCIAIALMAFAANIYVVITSIIIAVISLGICIFLIKGKALKFTKATLMLSLCSIVCDTLLIVYLLTVVPNI